MIQATRKDGSPVALGDWVMTISCTGKRQSGIVTEYGDAMYFTESMRRVLLRTYTVRCRDGTEFRTHAWNIKLARPPLPWQLLRNENRIMRRAA